MELFNAYVQIDEDGYFMANNLRVQDEDYGLFLFEHLKKAETGEFVTLADDQPVIVEAFDEPLVAHQITREAAGQWRIRMPYGFEQPFDLHSLTVDEWDRFHGRVQSGLPFVLSRAAQAEFFNLCDEFDDESVTIDGQWIGIGPWLVGEPAKTDPTWWNDIYVNEPNPGFDLKQPAPALITLVNRLKLPKSRVLVLGAGQCNDAFYFAQQGHLVTAVDFSDKGFAEARQRHGEHPNLQMVQADIFNLPRDFDRSFDLIFEHTCYCAIDPTRRTELVNVWRRCLVETGHLLGIFFAMDRPQGPPYGGSEWEVRERLKKAFQFLYWSRSHESSPRRQGKEFTLYAAKRSL